MRTTITRIAGAAVAGALMVGAVAGCSANTTPEPVATAPSETTEPAAEATPAPTEAATPEVAIPTTAGEIVPADLVEVAREAGASVYVSPNGDGSGLIVDPAGALPEQVQADIASLPNQPGTMQQVSDMAVAADTQRSAMKDAGLRAFYVTRAPTVEGLAVVELNYRVSGLNIPDSASFGSTIATTREGALALAAPTFAAYPDVPVIG